MPVSAWPFPFMYPVKKELKAASSHPAPRCGVHKESITLNVTLPKPYYPKEYWNFCHNTHLFFFAIFLIFIDILIKHDDKAQKHILKNNVAIVPTKPSILKSLVVWTASMIERIIPIINIIVDIICNTLSAFVNSALSSASHGSVRHLSHKPFTPSPSLRSLPHFLQLLLISIIK